MIAEEVAEVNRDLVVRDEDGKPYTVRYEAVNAMLLNEFLKEHRKVEQQRKDFEAALANQQKQIETLAAGLQKVSVQLELNNSRRKRLRTATKGVGFMRSCEIIADRLSATGWSLGCVSALDSERRTMWIVDAHRDGKRFVVRADEKLTAFRELESALYKDI